MELENFIELKIHRIEGVSKDVARELRKWMALELRQIKQNYSKLVVLCSENSSIIPDAKQFYYALIIFRCFFTDFSMKQLYFCLADFQALNTKELGKHYFHYINLLKRRIESKLLAAQNLHELEESLQYVLMMNIDYGLDISDALLILKSQITAISINSFKKTKNIEEIQDCLLVLTRIKLTELFEDLKDQLIYETLYSYFEKYMENYEINEQFLRCINLFKVLCSRNLSHFSNLFKINSFSLNKTIDLQEKNRVALKSFPLIPDNNFVKGIRPFDKVSSPHILMELFKKESQPSTFYSKEVLVKIYTFYPSPTTFHKIHEEQRILRRLSGHSHFPELFFSGYLKVEGQEEMAGLKKFMLVLSYSQPLKDFKGKLELRHIHQIIDGYFYLTAHNIPAKPATIESIHISPTGHIVIADFSFFTSLKYVEVNPRFYDTFGDLKHLIPVREEFIFYLAEFLKLYFDLFPAKLQADIKNIVENNKAGQGNLRKSIVYDKSIEDSLKASGESAKKLPNVSFLQLLNEIKAVKWVN